MTMARGNGNSDAASVNDQWPDIVSFQHSKNGGLDMRYVNVNGSFGWAISESEPSWRENEKELERKYNRLLSDIEKATKRAAMDENVDGLDYLFHRITGLMKSALTLAKKLHDE
jgi:hypothetical protein